MRLDQQTCFQGELPGKARRPKVEQFECWNKICCHRSSVVVCSAVRLCSDTEGCQENWRTREVWKFWVYGLKTLLKIWCVSLAFWSIKPVHWLPDSDFLSGVECAQNFFPKEWAQFSALKLLICYILMLFVLGAGNYIFFMSSISWAI